MEYEEKEYIKRKLKDSLDKMRVIEDQNDNLIVLIKKGEIERFGEDMQIRLQYARIAGEFLAYSEILMKDYEKTDEMYRLLRDQRRSVERILLIYEKGISKLLVDELKR